MDIANKSKDVDSIKIFSRMAYEIIKNTNDVSLLENCANNLAYAYGVIGKYDSAIVFYKRYYFMVSERDSRQDMARTLSNMGICYKNLGKFMEMWNCFRQGKELFEELNYYPYICWTTMEIGESYEHFGMYQQAREYYNNALDIAKDIDDATAVARANFHLGHSSLYEYSANPSEEKDPLLEDAHNYLLNAINLCPADGDDADSVRCKSMLALTKCYLLMSSASQNGHYVDSCRHCLDKYSMMPVHKSISDSLDVEIMRATLMVRNGSYKAAIPLLEKVSQLPVRAAEVRQMAEVYRLLASCYESIGKSKESYYAQKKYYDIFNEFSDEENMRRSANFAAQTEISVKRQEQEDEQKRQQAIADADKAYWETLFKYMMIGIVAAVAITLIILFSLQKKRRLSKELKERNDKLLAQRDIINRQKNDEEIAQAIILSGVEYASKIQSQAIGNEDSVSAIFPESFVYYRPRNIVSGDWYMPTVLRGHRIMIEADCTGHGIPGALLSMLGVSALRDIINRLRHTSVEILPGVILDEMRTSIKKSLNKSFNDGKSNIDDGMDMTIIVLPPSGDKLLFGSASQNAVLVSDGQAVRLKGDANPIGNYVREKEHFTTTTVDVKPGDAVYLFSDGIQDQVGGDDFRKYSFRRLMDLLARNSALPMQQQLQLFVQDLEAYVGSNAQVDDRTLIGIRI